MSIVIKLLCMIALYILSMFATIQVISFFYIHNWRTYDGIVMAFESLPSFDFNLLFYDDLTYRVYIIVSVFCFITFFTMLFGKNGKDFRKRWWRNKYERQNYNKLLNHLQRMRGTQRVQYDDNGEITRFTFEVFAERLFQPIVFLQNKLAEQRHWAPNRVWNSIRKYKVDDKEQFHSGGVPIQAYRKYGLFGKYNRIYYLTGNIHNMFVGMTGKGKSMTFVLAMMQSYIMANESIVVHDPKKELYAYMKNLLKIKGYKVIVLNFDEPTKGDGWNPLDYPWRKWNEAIDKWKFSKIKVDLKLEKMQFEEFYEIVKGSYVDEKTGEIKDKLNHEIQEKYHNMKVNQAEINFSEADELILDIARTMAYEEDSRQPYFWQGAASMIAGGARLLFEEGKEQYANFKSIRYLYQLGDDHKEGRQTTIAKYLQKNRPLDAKSAEFIATYLDAEGITKSSLKSVFQNKIDLVTAHQNITEMTGKSTFDMRDIFKQKTAVFILTQDEKTTYYPLVTMFLKQLYEVGIKVTKENPKEKKLKIPMNWIIDEFALLPEIMDVDAIYAAARSRGVRMNTFYQSISQLYKKYELNGSKSIIDNNSNVIYLGSGLTETLDFFRERAGKEVYYNRKQDDYIERDIVSNERLNKIEKGRTLFTSVEWNPYIAKLPPYYEYVFAQHPDWSIEERIVDKIDFFNIKKEFKKSSKEGFTNQGIAAKYMSEVNNSKTKFKEVTA